MNAIASPQYMLFPLPTAAIEPYLQRISLDNYHAEIHERWRHEKRRRRQAVTQQVKQLQDLVSQLQTKRQNHSLHRESRHEIPVVPLNADILSSIERTTLRLVQQNEDLFSFIKNREMQSQTPERTSAQEHDGGPPIEKDEEYREADCTSTLLHQTSKSVTARQGHEKVDSGRWIPSESHLEVEWTDSEEEATLIPQLLEKLLEIDPDQRLDILPLPGVINESDTNEQEDVTIMLKKNTQKQKDRMDSRRKMSQQIDESLVGVSTGFRRPQWRITLDAENGVVMPLNDNGEVAEIPMPPSQVFRSAAIAVMASNVLRKLSLQKQLRLKDKAMKDLESMLNVYFDATRMWLSKTVKTPLGSVVQDLALDLDISTKPTIFPVSRGISSWFSRSKSNTKGVVPISDSVNDNQASSALLSKAVKLKVRVKGLIDVLIKALDKNDVPHGIEELWKHITADGVYFPPSYQLHAFEASALDFDSLGATRNMGGCNPQTRKPHFHIVWINFVLVRILIPHVILGAGGEHTPKSVATNLRNVATLLYCILSRISSLPPIMQQEAAPLNRPAGRRRSVEVTPEHNTSKVLAEETSKFQSLQDVHARLIPDHQFPIEQLDEFCYEQQSRLADVLQRLQAKLHGAAASSQ